MSISWLSDAAPRPAILVLPPDAASLDEADAAIELWEHYSRKILDPVQRLTVQVMMATGSDGRWAAGTTGREMPRQNGKGDEIEVVELWGLTQRGEAILHTVHDAVLLATQAQQRLLGVLEGHADLRKRVARRHLGTGQQMTEMRNGGVIWYRTRTNGGGRGVDNVDRVVIDEAQHATDEHAAAITPTLLANPNPQLNAMGSAGIFGKSSWWWRQRRRALSAAPGRFGYVGHTAERVWLDDTGRARQDPVDVHDRSLWLAANPAVFAGRGVGVSFLEEQLLRLGPAGFGREHLGVWDADIDTDGVHVFAPGVWETVQAVVPKPEHGLVFAVAVNVERSSASIGWSSAGGTCGLHARRPGTGWVVDELARLAKEYAASVAVSSAEGGVLLALEQAGVKCRPVPTGDDRSASMWFHDAVVERRVVVQRHADLDAAVQVAVKREGAGGFTWDRRSGDVSALQAVTWAAYTAQAAPVDAPAMAFVVKGKR